ncbi:VOC family protein [Paenibacillus pini]|uniref:glyoxalase/bleomycin resistance/dioxygenase family protein n=1 Tax=Paenibacillus pini TaxID=669461 RepID=UPI00055AAC87|nr:glyoxalase/bleomycin resistance/dioxygenase family protein [Paenibacillus pini]
MIRTETIIAVDNVVASSKWYQLLLDCTNTHMNGAIFDQLVDADGTILLCLHHWGDHGHPSLLCPDQGLVGNGLSLFFRLNDFDKAWDRAKKLVSKIEAEPHINPLAGHNEFTVRDLDGYYITICSNTII